jgi:hypothetical protein
MIKGTKHSKESIEKLRFKALQIYKERKKTLGFQKGHEPFLKKHSEKTKKLLSELRRGKKNPMYGKHPSLKTRLLMSQSHSGKKNHFFGKHHTPESRRKMRLNCTYNMLGKHHTKETKRKIKESWKKHTPEIIRKSLRRRTPSSLEAEAIQIFKKYSLPYIFTGNGTFFIENYNPDFVNANGQKIILEVYARYFKGLHGSIDSWKQKRRRAYGEYGYKVLFFNEAQINEEFILKRLGGE